jgi:hypothetical protein
MIPATPDLPRELTANPPSTCNHDWKAEQPAIRNADVIDRAIEEWNLAGSLEMGFASWQACLSLTPESSAVKTPDIHL